MTCPWKTLYMASDTETPLHVVYVMVSHEEKSTGIQTLRYERDTYSDSDSDKEQVRDTYRTTDVQKYK